MPNLSATEVLTEPCRISFPSLWKPRENTMGGRSTYQCVVLIPPTATETLAAIDKAIEAAIIEKFGKKVAIPAGKMPIRDALEKEDMAGFEEGWRFANVKSGQPVPVVDQLMKPILPDEGEDNRSSRLFPGCWCNFFLKAYAWNHKEGGKGVSLSLNGVQLVREDERLDGRTSINNVFAPMAAAEDGESAADALDSVMGG